MQQTKLAITFLTLFISLAHAQLGPKDGANLKPTDLERVNVGDTPPDFTLEDRDGNRISLSDFLGKKMSSWFFIVANGDRTARNSSAS
jgi:cytochrome oxidase Cu insertion factor (SCO1/SenC/PrrC family)